MKGFIGSANIDTNSRLCMSSAVAAHKRAFGEDLVPVTYEDLEQADLIVLVGSNTAWCHPVLYQRIVKAKEQRPELQGRRHRSAAHADLRDRRSASAAARGHRCLALQRPAELAAASTDIVDPRLHRAAHPRCGARTAGRRQYRGRCRRRGAPLRRSSRIAAGGFLPPVRAHRARRHAFSQGVNQSSAGTDKANSIINCHLLTGRIGRPGAGPFSITGQPNAMGGREVGGLANTLAAHMELDDAEHRAHRAGVLARPRASRSGPDSRRSSCSRRCTPEASRRSGSSRPIPSSACRTPTGRAQR